MKKIILIFSLVLCSSSFVLAQASTAPTQQSTPDPKLVLIQPQTPEQRIIEEQRKSPYPKIEQELIRTKDIVRTTSKATRVNIEQIYRKSNKKEQQILAPDKIDLEKFAVFLREPKTGLIKLAADKGCADNTNVITVNSDCLKYTMPGAGSSYSFRVKDYRIQRLADLTFINDNFKVSGVLAQGILVGLNNFPIEKVNLQTKGLKFLVDFQPQSDYEKAKEVSEQFTKGILKDGLIYRRELRVIENLTYVLRSIAYNGKYYHSIDGVTYNEFDFDKRQDVIIVFRVVSKSADGSITILWKELARTDSPEIKLKVDETNKPIKENNFSLTK